MILPTALPRFAKSFRVLLEHRNNRVLNGEWTSCYLWNRTVEDILVIQGVDLSFIATTLQSNKEGLVDRYREYHDSYYPVLFWHNNEEGKWTHYGGNVEEFVKREEISLDRILDDPVVEWGK